MPEGGTCAPLGASVSFVLMRSASAAPPGPESSTPSFNRNIPAWAPLRSPIFRALWIASVVSNIGSWMHDTGANWLMTSLNPDSRMVAAVAAAGSLPMFFLALPAGALADVLDRRLLIACMQGMAAVLAFLLGVFTVCHVTGEWMLLLFTALLSGVGALTGPAWQSVTPEIVKKRQLPAAMALGGIAFNISRVTGPALGGAIMGLAEKLVGTNAAPGILFLFNGVSFAGVVIVMLKWKRAPRDNDMPPEHVLSAIRTGLRYMNHSPELRVVFIRLGGFILFASALFSLLALHSREDLGLDAFGYGTMLGCFGLGAIAAGLSMPPLRDRFGADRLIKIASVGVVLQLVDLALVTNPWWARAVMMFGGFFWPLAMLTFNVVIIRSVPDWVRSRAASMFILVFAGATAIGSSLWGWVAHQVSIPVAYVAAAAGLLVCVCAMRTLRIVEEGGINRSPSAHWPDPVVAVDPTPESGPVMVTTEYEIAPDDVREFVAAMHQVRLIRLRDGALRWNLFQDIAHPNRWLETMLVDSWNEHLRQHARVTHADREIEEVAHSFHRGSEPPRVSHFLSSTARNDEPNDD